MLMVLGRRLNNSSRRHALARTSNFRERVGRRHRAPLAREGRRRRAPRGDARAVARPEERPSSNERRVALIGARRLRRERRERTTQNVAEAAAALRRAGLVANQNVGAVGDHVALPLGDDDDVSQFPGDLRRDVIRFGGDIQPRREAF